MNTLGEKFKIPRQSLGGKLEGIGNSLGGKITLGKKANHKLPKLPYEQNKKSPLERR